MVAIGWTAWCAVTNSNPWPGSYWSPVQTRPRLLTGSRVLRGAGEPHGEGAAVRRVPRLSARRCARPRPGPLASPSSGSPAPRARTGGPVLPASALYGLARRSAAGTPASTAGGSSASWTFLSAPTMGCPRKRSWVRTHPRGMKVEYRRPAPRAGQRRTRVVRRVRRKRDVGASGTPHCCFEHGEQTRDHDRSCRPRRLAEEGTMERIIERGCGLDVHKKSIAACVRIPGANGQRTQEVRTFGTTATELLALRDWLQGHGVTHVAMESTGVYWKPVFYVLEEVLTCVLVNPFHMRQVPGRKTDEQDWDWIAQ